MTNEVVQALVDEHARYGMFDAEIRSHLREAHDVGVEIAIPPPSNAARNFRKLNDLPALIANAKGDLRNHYHVPREIVQKVNFSEHEFSKQVLTAEGHAAEFLASSYIANGITHLDRFIHSLGSASADVAPKGVSHFEIVQQLIQSFESRTYGENTNPIEIETHALYACINKAVLPWFDETAKTCSAQVTSDIAEHLLNLPSLPSQDAAAGLCAAPFYLDVKTAETGIRAVSAVYTVPTEDRQSFSYMAVVEWIGQGYESLFFGDSRKGNTSIIRLASEDLPIEALESSRRLYEPMHAQVMKLVTMAWRHYEQSLPEVRNTDFIERCVRHYDPKMTGKAQRKERLRSRSCSYFRVVHLRLPKGVTTAAIKGRNSWSLDHLVTVNGHLRWQAYGEGRKQHRLIWIDTYDKGQGSRLRPAINPELLVLESA